MPNYEKFIKLSDAEQNQAESTEASKNFMDTEKGFLTKFKGRAKEIAGVMTLVTGLTLGTGVFKEASADRTDDVFKKFSGDVNRIEQQGSQNINEIYKNYQREVDEINQRYQKEIKEIEKVKKTNPKEFEKKMRSNILEVIRDFKEYPSANAVQRFLMTEDGLMIFVKDYASKLNLNLGEAIKQIYNDFTMSFANKDGELGSKEIAKFEKEGKNKIGFLILERKVGEMMNKNKNAK